MASSLLVSVLIGAFNLQSTANADEKVLMTVDHSRRFWIANWMQDKHLREVSPPQVVSLAAGCRVYGACGERIVGNKLGGASYCSASHTIYLLPEELQAFYKALGSSAVDYVVAHEIGHAIQAAYGMKLSGPPRELQADCLAGLVFRMGSRELGITRDSVLAMATAAYSIGSDSLCSGAKRTYSLLSGTGVFKATCESPQMQALAVGRVKDRVLQKIKQAMF